MANLPAKYDRRVRSVLGYRAVWEPGANASLGDVMTQKKGILTAQGALADFGVTFNTKDKKPAEGLTLNAAGVSETLFQAGAEVPSVSDLQLSAEAELKIKFSSSDTYYLKTTQLSGRNISNLLQVAKKIAKLGAAWRFRDFYIVWRILVAKELNFLGSIQRGRDFSFSGSGKALKRYLDTGVSAGLTKSSRRKLDLEITGAGGPVAIGVTRITRDGRARDV